MIPMLRVGTTIWKLASACVALSATGCITTRSVGTINIASKLIPTMDRSNNTIH